MMTKIFNNIATEIELKLIFSQNNIYIRNDDTSRYNSGYKI